MCRLFAYSGPPRDLGTFLLGEGGLEGLAREHPSGWGLAWWPAPRAPPVVRKEPVRADDPKSGYRAAVRDARAPLVLAHLRDASVGTLSVENTHPFAHGAWAFMHNGTVQRFADHRDALLSGLPVAARSVVRGQTDSETAFALFLDDLRTTAGLDASPDDAAPSLARVAGRLRRISPGTRDEPTSTTFVAANGEGAVAYRWVRGLHVLQGDGFAALASQPIGPREGWRAVEDGTVVILQGGRARVRRPQG